MGSSDASRTSRYDLTRITWIVVPASGGFACAFGYGAWEKYAWWMNVRGGLTIFFVLLCTLAVIQQIIRWATS